MYIKTKSVHFDAMTVTSYVGKICLYFFLMGRSRIFFGIMIKFHLGRAKGRGRRGYGEKLKMRVIFANFPLFSKI